jgi:DNA-binding CsgD family transcriptional regulator
MTISISDTRPAHGTPRPQDVFRRVAHGTATTEQRFVIVEGPTGAGKTHALAGMAAAARADGHGVVELRVAEGDPVVAASSIEALVTLVHDLAAASTTPHRRYVVLIDDFHLLAHGTRAMLHSVVERLVRSTGTVCVVAVDDRRLVPGWTDLQYVPLAPLTRDEAEALLRRDRVELPAARTAMLLRLAAGNPLLLHAVGRGWGSGAPADRSATFPRSYPRLGDAARSAVPVIDALSPEARDAALLRAVASVEFPDDLDLRFPSGEPMPGRFPETLLGPLERAHLLSTASPADLRRVRSTIAASDGVPERLRVLAEASMAPSHDDRLVPRLVALVDESLRLRRPEDAAVVLSEAARLTSSDARRGQFRARAAAVSAFIGDFALVDAEAERVADHAEAVPPSLTAATVFARAVRSGEIRAGRRAVVAALEASDSVGDDDLLIATLYVLCFLRGDRSWWDEASTLTTGRDIDPVLRLVEDCLHGAASDEEQPALYRNAGISAAEGQPWKAVALHVAWSLLDATDDRRDRVDAMLSRFASNTGLPGYLRTCRDAIAAYQAGRLTVATHALDRARASAEAWGAGTFAALTDAIHAQVLSVQGHPDRATELADRAADWALEHGAPLVAKAADHARSARDVAMGRFEEAHARSATRPSTEHGRLEDTYGPVELLDAVESAARLRIPEHGMALVTSAERALGARVSPRRSMILKACRAVLDGVADPASLFEEALDTVESDAAPYESARVRLAYGEWLRRSMHALDARTQFRLAASIFETLGADQWRARAQSELRVAGGAGASPVALDTVDLSEQERRVASLAAAGLTNKQIANQLFLSPRTVSGHLYRLFPKLGVTTRAGLRDALLGLGDHGRDGRA